MDTDGGTTLLSQVMAIWRDVLQVDDLDEGSDFFDVGGESLRAIRITAEVREIVSDTVPLTLIFEEPVLGQFVAALAPFS